jgi:DNA-binding MarR family transcriptional regulator
MTDEKEWYTMQEIASLLGVHYSRIRNAVATLTRLGAITTKENPLDNRVLLIHRDSIEQVRKAIFGN